MPNNLAQSSASGRHRADHADEKCADFSFIGAVARPMATHRRRSRGEMGLTGATLAAREGALHVRVGRARVGLVLCFAGARSLRLTVLVAGFGLCWLLADAFGANVATTFLVAAVGALALLVLSIVLSRFVIFVVGAAVGAVIGARLFALLGGEDPSWLLAVLFVPTFGFVAGFLAQGWGVGSGAWPPPSPALPLSCRRSARCSATISESCRRPTAQRSRPYTPSSGPRSRSSATKPSAPKRMGRTRRRPAADPSARPSESHSVPRSARADERVVSSAGRLPLEEQVARQVHCLSGGTQQFSGTRALTVREINAPEAPWGSLPATHGAGTR